VSPEEKTAHERALATARTKRWQAKNPEKVREAQRRRRAKDPDKTRRQGLDAYYRRGGKEVYKKMKSTPEGWRKWALSSAKQRAKKANLPFDISPADISIPDACPVFGTPFLFGTCTRDPNTPTLDRVDTSKGYVVGNVQVISWRANMLKGANTRESLQRLLKYVEKFECP
jgi:hypothetical protein